MTNVLKMTVKCCEGPPPAAATPRPVSMSSIISPGIVHQTYKESVRAFYSYNETILMQSRDHEEAKEKTILTGEEKRENYGQLIKGLTENIFHHCPGNEWFCATVRST